MPAPTLPTATFDPTGVVIGRKSLITITPTGGTATSLLVDYVSHNGGLTMGFYEAPGAAQGAAFVAGNWEKSRAELFKFKCKEISKLITLGLMSGSVVATAQLFIRDPKDAVSTVAILSEAFACTIFRDTGDAAFEAANPAEVTITIQSNKDGAVTLTHAGATA